MKKYDAVIIGAGPAGAACAIALARQNLKIALLEKREFPLTKACGEGILPPGVDHLKELGVLKYIDKQQCHSITGIRYSINNSSADSSFNEGLGLGINRSILSQAFFNTVKEYSNIHLIKANFSNFIYPKVSFIKDNHEQSIESNFLVGADGLRSPLRKVLGIKSKKPKFKRWAMTAHMAIKPWTNLVEIYLNNFVEAYITPTGPEEINIVLMWAPADFSPAKGPELFFSLLQNFPELYKRLAGQNLSHKAHAIGPFHHRVRDFFIDNHAALVGDAAGYIDPLTGEGINLGLFSGRLLAQIIGRKLVDGQRPSLMDLKNYQKKALKHGQAHAILTYSLLKLQGQPRLFEAAVKFFEQHPELLSAITSISMGTPPRLWLKHLDLYQFLPRWHNKAPP